jgi:hypothetical protein
MALTRIVVLNMIEILAGGFLFNRQPQKRLWDVEELTKQMILPIFPAERLAEFHDIKKARWKVLPGLSTLLSPCRATSSPAFSLSIHHSHHFFI